MHTCTREFVLSRNAQAAPEAQPALRAGLILPAVQLHGVSWCDMTFFFVSGGIYLPGPESTNII